MIACKLHLAALVALLGVASACGGSSGSSGTGDSSADGAGTPPAASAGPACDELAAAEEQVHVKNAHGTLEGTLLLPAGCGPRPVVLVIAGSGAVDRDGNEGGAGANTYALLAETLASKGVGSLRFDKAGVGASVKAAPPMESQMRVEDEANDAALFLAALRADARVGKVTIAGHSEGSFLGILVAEHAPVDAFVSLAGSGRPIDQVLREQLVRSIKDATLLATADAILDALAKGQTVADVPQELMSLFRPSVQPYLISWMKYDPAHEIASLTVPPVLVAQGTTDIQVTVGDADRLAAARPGAQLLVIDQMNHMLKSADASDASQQKAYDDPSLPVVSELVAAVAAIASPAVAAPSAPSP